MYRTFRHVMLASAAIMVACSKAPTMQQARPDPSGAFDNAIAAYQRGDYGIAYREFLTSAKQGDHDALVNLWLMSSGDDRCGIPPDEVTKFLQNSRGRDNATLGFFEAWSAYEGGGATKEQIEALSASPPLAEASAREGFPFAMFMTGNFYMGPTSLAFRAPRDPLRAFTWYSLAIRRGLSQVFFRDNDVEGLARKIGLTPEQVARGKEMTDQLDREVPKSRMIWIDGTDICQHQ